MNLKLQYVFFLIATSCFIHNACIAQESEILNTYISTALQHSFQAQESKAQLQQSELDFKLAKSIMYPEVSLNSRFSVARGGRIIDVPIADVLEAYSAHNSLTTPAGIENQSIPFLRQTEQETYINMTRPFWDMQVNQNLFIKRDLIQISELNHDVAARDIIENTKALYFTYLQSIELIQLYSSMELLAEENLRINQSLLENNKVGKENIFRSEEEILRWQQLVLEAENNKKNVQYFFNHTLNRPLNAEIDVDTTIGSFGNGNSFLNADSASREELALLTENIAIQDRIIKLQRAAYYPNIYGNVRLGYQSDEFSFTSEDDFFQASFVLQWKLFSGFGTKHEVAKAKIEKIQQKNRLEENKNLIAIEQQEAQNNVLLAEKSLEKSAKRVEFAERNYAIISKKFVEGLSNQVALIDAQTNLSNAKTEYIIATYNKLISLCALERAMASINLNNYNY
jgi:outer membrane protein